MSNKKGWKKSDFEPTSMQDVFKIFSHSDDLKTTIRVSTKNRKWMITMKKILNKVNQLKVQRKKC